MNVNGSRFHLLLGEADWARCRSDAALEWDAQRDELRLRAEPIVLGATPGEAAFGLGARRGVAADAAGNVYWIADDRATLRVRSNGSQRESLFWPAEDQDPPAGAGPAFTPLQPPVRPASSFTALTVTEDGYLVASQQAEDGDSLLAFDLVAGGPPQGLRWPSGAALRPTDMTPRRGGGLWLLEGGRARLWELDARLVPVGAAPPMSAPVPPLFQPLLGAATAAPAAPVPMGMDLQALAGGGLHAIAIEALDDGSLLILDQPPADRVSRVFRLRRDAQRMRLDAPVALTERAQDFLLARGWLHDGADMPTLLFVATASGNQALALAVDTRGDVLQLAATPELYPLRRFGGRGLVSVLGQACYDSGSSAVHWVPVTQHPRRRYVEGGELVTPVFDAGEPQCPWDRLLLDACIPAGTQVEVWCRAADDSSDGAVQAPWQLQPRPRLRGDGIELPWLRAEAARGTRRDAGVGTWELLLQQPRGRYLQLRLHLSGPGAATPRLRALRVWMPRFSYARRFLPAVLREAEQAASFLDRFLANMEGFNTLVEDRIVQVQALFDPRCAPAEALEWLADWFDLAFEPAWDERRRRLLIAHAMDFFRWRGTAHGLRLALGLAFNPCMAEADFAEPQESAPVTHPIRIVEAHLSRRVGALVAGDPGQGGALSAPAGGAGLAGNAAWTPAQGNAELVRRYAAARGGTASTGEQLRAFALLPPPQDPAPDDAAAAANALALAQWQQFALASFGFVPAAGNAERQRWQRFLQARHAEASDLPADASDAPLWSDFLKLPAVTAEPGLWRDFLLRRYRRIEQLNAAWQTHWAHFDQIALHDHLPASPAAQADWLQFEGQLLPMQRSAHRFAVLLPLAGVAEDPDALQRQLQLARRIVTLEKPAHTVFDVRFYWALNRVGEARLGLDTLLDEGSRSALLRPDTVLGRSHIGASFLPGRQRAAGSDRHRLAC